MAAIGISVQRFQFRYHPGPQRIEVDMADQLFQVGIAVLVVVKNISSLDAPGDNMMHRSRCVYSCASWHSSFISKPAMHVNVKEVPYSPLQKGLADSLELEKRGPITLNGGCYINLLT